MTFEEFQNKVKEEARKAGLTQYELYYSEEEVVSARAMNREISAFSSDKQCGAGFRCIVNGKMGYSATELFNEEQASELVRIAMENASTIESEDEVFIYSGSDSYKSVASKELPEQNLAQTVMALHEASLAANEKVQSNSTSQAFQVRSKVTLMNSEGLSLSNTCMLQGAGAMVVVKDGQEQYNGAEYVYKPFKDMDLHTIAQSAVDQGLAKIGAGLVPTGKYPVVFDADPMGDILSAYEPIFSADMAQKGRSLLAGKEGQKVASELITITDDPFYEESMVKTPFDAEGAATYTKNVIEAGVLKTLLHNLKTAKKAGIATTANASKGSYASPVDISPYTFYIAKGEQPLETLFANAGNGVYVTQVKGLHAGTNAITGDFSIECSGFMIHDGKKAEAVTSFTVSGNFFELLNKVQMVGSDLKFQGPSGFTMIGSPSLLIDELSVAGK